MHSRARAHPHVRTGAQTRARVPIDRRELAAQLAADADLGALRAHAWFGAVVAELHG